MKPRLIGLWCARCLTMAFMVALCGCAGRRVPSAEYKFLGPWGEPTVTVACELQYYIVGANRDLATLPVIEVRRLEESLEQNRLPEGLLKAPYPDLAGSVRYLVLRIVRPAAHSGKILTAHHEGPMVFEACKPGKRYVVEVPPRLFNNTNYHLCW